MVLQYAQNQTEVTRQVELKYFIFIVLNDLNIIIDGFV